MNNKDDSKNKSFLMKGYKKRAYQKHRDKIRSKNMELFGTFNLARILMIEEGPAQVLA